MDDLKKKSTGSSKTRTITIPSTFSKFVQENLIDESPLRYVEFPYDFARTREEAIFKRNHREPIGELKENVNNWIKEYLEDDNYNFNEFVYDVLCYGQKVSEDLEDSSLPV